MKLWSVSWVLGLLCSCGVLGQQLFRVSPGGEADNKPSSVYGGPINTFDGAAPTDLFRYDFSRLDVSNPTKHKPKRIIKDPASDQFLVEYQSNHRAECLVAAGKLCDVTSQGDPSRMPLSASIANVRIVDSNNRYFLDHNCGNKCGWDSFSLYDGSVYFLLSAVFGRYPSQLSREIHLRKLSGCEDLIGRAKAGGSTVQMPVLDCSIKIATLHSEAYAWPNPRLRGWTVGSMTAVKLDNAFHRLYTQLVIESDQGVHMQLLQIELRAHRTARVDVLHSRPLSVEYGGTWMFPGMGEVAYMDGTLCWTAADSLLCGVLHAGNQLEDVNVMIHKGDAYRAGVCKGQLSPLPHGHVLTGVTIARRADPLIIYFGCYTDTPAEGGTGLLTMSALGNRQMSAVFSGSSRVLSGSLLYVDAAGQQCSSTGAVTQPECNVMTSYMIKTINRLDQLTPTEKQRMCKDCRRTQNVMYSAYASSTAVVPKPAAGGAAIAGLLATLTVLSRHV